MKPALRRRILVWATVAVVVIAVVYGFLPKPIAVEVVTAGRGRLAVTVEEEGKTRVKDKFVVSAPVAGFLRRVLLDVGDAVAKGQIVARLEPLRSQALDPRARAEAEASLAAAEASLRSAAETARAAAADAEYARKQHERMEGLYEKGYVSRDDLDRAESAAKQAGANRLAAEAAVKEARAVRDRAQSLLGYSAAEGVSDRNRIVDVASPVDGRVLKVHRESEGVTAAGDPIIDVGNPELLEVKVEVLSADAVAIRPGTRVIFEQWGGEKPLEGTVRVVEPEAFTKISSLGVEEQRVLVIADFTSPPDLWRRLGDEYRVEAKFIVWEQEDVLQVPATALFRRGDSWAVFVVRDKRARLRQVAVGHRSGLAAEITSGLSEGEQVINHPQDMITDGVRVAPTR
jgi:HlyD family secretion protein